METVIHTDPPIAKIAISPRSSPRVFGALGDKLLPYTHLEYLPFKPDSQGFGAKPCQEADLACRARLFGAMFDTYPCRIISASSVRAPGGGGDG